MKNILMSMYDQTRSGPPPRPPGPQPTSSVSTIGTALKIPKEVEIPIRVKLETMEEIKKTKTEDITRSLSIHASKLTDIARFETDKQTHETVRRNLNFLQNPMKAETPAERQKYMNIRTELFSRAIKEDRVAKQVLSSLSTSRSEQVQKKQELLQSVSEKIPITRIVSIKVKIPQDKVTSVTNSFSNSVVNNQSVVNSMTQNTQLPQTQIQTILKSFVQNIDKPFNEVVNTISQETNISKEKISQVIHQTKTLVNNSQTVNEISAKESIPEEQVVNIVQTLPASLQSAMTITRYISQETKIPSEKITSITQQLLQSVIKDQSLVTQIGKETGLKEPQIKQIYQTFIQNINQPVSTTIQTISEKTNIEKVKVAQALNTGLTQFKLGVDITQEVAQKENLQRGQVQKILQTQMPVAMQPEHYVEEAVSVPPTVSLEEYEQVKTMWKAQYTKGEVPVSETITSREKWIDNDIVYITNTLNKLLSTDETIRQNGLDDVGYILPIFLINNLKGDELMVYLKAKIEAAKEVKEQINRDREIAAGLKAKTEEEFVEVQKPKAEEKEKVMEMKQEMKPEEKSPADQTTKENTAK